MRGTILAAAALLMSTCALAQSRNFESVLAGKDYPHSLKLKDLTPEWRHVSIASADKSASGGDAMKQLMQLGMMGQMGAKGQGGNDAAGAMAAMSMLGGLFGGGGEESAPSFYTQGRTTSIASETFLIAYKLNIKAPSFLELAAQSEKNGGKEPDFAKLAEGAKPTEESEVSLTLINVKSIASMGSIRPFDLKKELETAGKSGGGGLMDLFALGAKGAEQAPAIPDTPVPEVKDLEAGLLDARLAIKEDSQLSGAGNSITVNGANNSVTLRGSVTSAKLKTRAENLVRNSMKTYGLNPPISNQLTVKSR